MLDETMITETPPLYSCYCPLGEQCRIYMTGQRAKRVLHGVINIGSGEVLMLSTEEWNMETHQAFLRMIRSPWRGWNVVLFEDRGTPHTAASSLALAREMKIELRFLPRATPELNAMDQLWRRVKGEGLANKGMQAIEALVDRACTYLLEMTAQERLKQAGVLSGNFWLAP
jgi:DDE superfamily endonuclease